MDFHFVFCDIKSDIAILEKIIREIAFDDVPAESATDEEILDTAGGIYLHDVPQNGLAADLNHRLRTQVTFLADSCALAPCENYGFHGLLFALSMAAFVVRWSRGASER